MEYTKHTHAFTIIEIIISMSMLGILSMFIFSVTIVLQRKTEVIHRNLIRYIQVQSTMLFLDDLISIYGIPQTYDIEAIDMVSSKISLPTSIRGGMDEKQLYAIFTRDGLAEETYVICGFFHDVHLKIDVNFSCHFVYPQRISSHELISIDTTVDISLSVREIYNYSILEVDIGEYTLTAGFLPSIQRVLQ